MYSSPNFIRMIKSSIPRMALHLTRVVKKRNAFWVKEKPEEKRQFGRPSRMWKVNNKTGLTVRGWERVDPTHRSRSIDR